MVAFTTASTAAQAASFTDVVTATPTNAAIYPTGVLATNGAAYGPLSQKINTDIVTINNTTAVINVTKSITGAYLPSASTVFVPGLTTGPRGTKVVHRLSYTNSGNAAGPISIRDTFGATEPTTAGYSYVAGSSLWSSTGSATVAIADTVVGNPIAYTATATSITATIDNITPVAVGSNVSGYIEFQVLVTNTALLGYTTTDNIAYFNDTTTPPAASCPVATATCQPTNYSPFIVTGLNYNVVANNALASTADGDNVTPTGNDQVYVDKAAAGQTVSFDNYIHNTGLLDDTFNINVNQLASTFPAGTTFALFQADGTTPLLDTASDTDNIPDTGVVLVGAAYKVVLKATLPANAVAGVGPYTVAKIATSAGDPTISNTVFDQLGSITGSSAGLELTTNGSGQIYPGGTIVYPHSLVNHGSAVCGVAANGTTVTNYTFTVTNSMAAANWQYTLYRDSNGNGLVDGTDTLIGGGVANGIYTDATTPLGNLAANAAMPILVKVTAPSGATAVDVDTITVTAAANCSSATATTTNLVKDKTTITLSEMRVVKQQALATWGAGTCNAAGAYGTTPLQQKPGDCIWYRVVATNQGSQVANNVRLDDTTPAFTTYNAAAATCTTAIGTPTGAPTVTNPAVGTTGAVSCASWTTVPSAAAVQMDFAVRINP